MFSYVFCVVALIVALVLVQPIEGETNEELHMIQEPLCRFVRSAVSQTQFEEEAEARLQEGEFIPVTDSDRRSPLHLENRTDRELFESSLTNWLFFEDLARKQQSMIEEILVRCEAKRSGLSVAASVFAQLDVSKRATFVGITHAMLNTQLIDREDGRKMGDSLQLIDELLDIHGENEGARSDQQFQLILRLAPGAFQKLERATSFERGENHVFHKLFPNSFRQFRRMGLHGQEAGLHISVSPDGYLAEIHIDYRFGLLHLGPANSDVRAQGNHQRHVDRWPVFGFATRRVRVRRAVLQ